MVSHTFLQGIFLIQELNPGLPHCRQILYHLSHQESPWSALPEYCRDQHLRSIWLFGPGKSKQCKVNRYVRKIGSTTLSTHKKSWASLVAQTVKKLLAMQETLILPLVRKIPWRKERLPTPVFLPGEFHGQRSLVGYSPWSCRVQHDWATNTHI